MPRKIVVHNRKEYANMLTLLEGGKSEIKVGDMRQAFKLIVNLEAALIMAGRRSAIMLLRREAVAKAKAMKLKKK